MSENEDPQLGVHRIVIMPDEVDTAIEEATQAIMRLRGMMPLKVATTFWFCHSPPLMCLRICGSTLRRIRSHLTPIYIRNSCIRLCTNSRESPLGVPLDVIRKMGTV